MYHYTYRITNKIKNKHYYGVRSSKIKPESDLGYKYFSSSTDKEFIQDQKKNPDYYKYKVIKVYPSRKEAILLECAFHSKFDVGVNPNFYNKAKQSDRIGFDITGVKGLFKPSKEQLERMRIRQLGKKHSQATKDKISKGNLGKTLSDETKEKIRQSAIGRKHTQEWKDNHSKMVSGKNHPLYGKPLSNETKEKISKSSKGKTLSKEHRNKLRGKRLPYGKHQKVTCPHCNKEGGQGIMKRWHFDNCKLKI